jgi:VanZ family protein
LKLLTLWGPVVVVMALIFSASAMSDPGAPPGGLSDKSAHFLAYGALGAALIRALADGRTAGMTTARVLLAAVIASAYGVSDEVHQSFVPQRSPELMDLAADAAGGLSGAAALAALAKWTSRLRAGSST